MKTPSRKLDGAYYASRRWMASSGRQPRPVIGAVSAAGSAGWFGWGDRLDGRFVLAVVITVTGRQPGTVEHEPADDVKNGVEHKREGMVPFGQPAGDPAKR